MAHATGKPMTFALCVLVIAAWAISGPFFHYSDTWQLVINTSTTIITFLQVFLIQNTQKRPSAAIQAKLGELIRASAARNRFIGIEELTEEELKEIRAACDVRGKRARADQIEDAADAAEDRANEKARKAVARHAHHTAFVAYKLLTIGFIAMLLPAVAVPTVASLVPNFALSEGIHGATRVSPRVVVEVDFATVLDRARAANLVLHLGAPRIDGHGGGSGAGCSNKGQTDGCPEQKSDPHPMVPCYMRHQIVTPGGCLLDRIALGVTLFSWVLE